MTTTAAPPVSFAPTRADTPGRRHRRNWSVTTRSISISLHVWSQIASPSLSAAACARVSHGALGERARLRCRGGREPCIRDARRSRKSRCTEHTNASREDAAVTAVPLGRASSHGICADLRY
ncbi:hypothetical protein MTO96_009966 [Rhipicephalus appendiculatus]